MQRTILFLSSLAVTSLLMLIGSSTGFAQLELGSPFGDNMVLQHDQPVKIWGWSTPGEAVTVQIKDQSATATSNGDGKWQMELPAPGLGDSFEISVTTTASSLEIKNVVGGEIWICSGQSNMEWSVKNSRDAEQEISAANYPMIRHMKVDRLTSLIPKAKAPNSGWQVCSPATVGNFTAVGYYFARRLHKDLDVPIGLVNTSWGGTIIETWIRGDTIAKHPDFTERVKTMQATALDRNLTASATKRIDDWDKAFAGLRRIPAEKYETTSLDDSAWGAQKLPGAWEQQGFEGIDGVAWYRRKVAIPAAWKNQPLSLSLAQIDDADQTYVNGVLVGENNRWDADRLYTVPAEAVSSQELLIAVKVTDGGMGGGIVGDAEKISLALSSAPKKNRIALSGPWKFKLEPATEKIGARPKGIGSNQNQPMMLNNAMVAPLVPFAVKGTIWYQGESNAGRGRQYRSLFPMLINDWRDAWNNDMSFYWVQLANFKRASQWPYDSDWAELREAQSMTCALPKTGQAVIIDIGEAGDIHPKNKQDVGDRLALIALAKDYNKDVKYSGPVFKSLVIDGQKACVSFDYAEGLTTSNGAKLKRFEIAGADQKFYWADAVIEGDGVVVSSAEVESPVAVRYAWAENPEGCNLTNATGLPASPFRTDDWVREK